MSSASNSKRRSRKGRGGPGAQPRAVPSRRRDERADRSAQTIRAEKQSGRALGTVGERPNGFFAGVPVSEFAILAGIVCLVIGLIRGSGRAQEAGMFFCALGALEVCAREHLSGFRSHTSLLALLPAVIVEIAYVFVVGVPGQPILLMVPVIPVFVLCFVLLRRRFSVARHRRVVGHN